MLQIHPHVAALHAILIVRSSSASADAGRKTWETCDTPVSAPMASVERALEERGDGSRNGESLQMAAAPDYVGGAARAENDEAAIVITNAEDAAASGAVVSEMAVAL